ncbi:DUF1254 domain-containing protein [Terriglobus albidus]|uniref:DUF1254 domain-containing protein n=1 Tax=Terriglobus albidus TaxID=1592106 RepID=UPI0021E0294D|nr:DUF1254 domain-containing protein [Terriglobus albidus]
MFSVMSNLNAQDPTPAEVQSIAEKAYVYAYPLVMLETTRASMPTNHLLHVAAFPDANFHTIVRPNADTLYSTAWIDVSKEPMLLHVPDSAGRYYLLQFMDAWTETFADPGKRTTGTSEAWYALVGPGWSAKLPDHVVRIDAPTNLVWLLGRTQTNGVADYDNVHAFQRGMRLVPLSQYPGQDQKPTPPVTRPAMSGPTAPEQIKAMTPEAFFAAFATAMKINPPHAEDAPVMQQLARIGLVPGQDFDPSKLTAEQRAALEEGVKAAAAHIEKYVASGAALKPGWSSFQGTVGRYGANYVARAVTARIAVGANPAEDAVYIGNSTDANGEALNGSRSYRLHFEASQLPPVRAFWSVTAYDKEGYFIANPINRYAIGDRDHLKVNPDGSLDLYIQNQNPGPAHEANWLPCGEGPFNLMLRLYWPEAEILNGSWHPPAVKPLP